MSAVIRVSGPAMVLPGDEIDTDRIIPARFLKAVTFEGLEKHAFEDDRRQAAERGFTHPFDDAARRQSRVLLVGHNFGCGSSREHAPQALFRWGIRAIVGESFAEIFMGNALMLGLPCVSATRSDLDRLRRLATADPTAEFVVDLEARRVTAGTESIGVGLPDPTRDALLSGAWDATGLLLADYDEVRRKAASLPYIAGF